MLEKPEWQGGTVPFDAPVLDKPEKIIEIPEPKQDEPKEEPKQDPKPKQDKPNTPAPKTKEEPKEAPKEAPKVEGVKIVKEKEESEKPIKAYSAPATLPNTGTEFGIAISLLGLAGLSLGMVALKKKEN